MKQIFSCGVIPFSLIDGEYKVLILKNGKIQDGGWTFPKGKKEENETDEQTALREFQEETGIEKCYILDDIVYEYSYSNKQESGEIINKNISLFIGFIKDKKVKIQQEEICDFKFISVYKLDKYFPWKESKKLIKDIITYYENNLK